MMSEVSDIILSRSEDARESHLVLTLLAMLKHHVKPLLLLGYPL